MVYVEMGVNGDVMLMSGVAVSVICTGVNVKRVRLQRHECEDEGSYPRFF